MLAGTSGVAKGQSYVPIMVRNKDISNIWRKMASGADVKGDLQHILDTEGEKGLVGLRNELIALKNNPHFSPILKARIQKLLDEIDQVLPRTVGQKIKDLAKRAGPLAPLAIGAIAVGSAPVSAPAAGLIGGVTLLEAGIILGGSAVTAAILNEAGFGKAALQILQPTPKSTPIYSTTHPGLPVLLSNDKVPQENKLPKGSTLINAHDARKDNARVVSITYTAPGSTDQISTEREIPAMAQGNGFLTYVNFRLDDKGGLVAEEASADASGNITSHGQDETHSFDIVLK